MKSNSLFHERGVDEGLWPQCSDGVEALLQQRGERAPGTSRTHGERRPGPRPAIGQGLPQLLQPLPLATPHGLGGVGAVEVVVVEEEGGPAVAAWFRGHGAQLHLAELVEQVGLIAEGVLLEHCVGGVGG